VHEKTFAAIAKLKDIEVELHRLKNALEITNKALDARREWVEVECPLCGEMAVAHTHPNLNKEKNQ
jgi:predicted RNA-binding Zn-ribbon protein involved in translation (DUF1610 family)